MKANTPCSRIVRGLLALSLIPFTPLLRAADPTPWDDMQGNYSGAITVIPKNGKSLKATGTILFTSSALTLAGNTIPRQDVKEVVIRRPRQVCCEELLAGIFPLALVLSSIGSSDFPKSAIPIIIIGSPFILGAAAVTAPPFFLIEGIRRLKPAEIMYRVVP